MGQPNIFDHGPAQYSQPRAGPSNPRDRTPAGSLDETTHDSAAPSSLFALARRGVPLLQIQATAAAISRAARPPLLPCRKQVPEACGARRLPVTARVPPHQQPPGREQRSPGGRGVRRTGLRFQVAGDQTPSTPESERTMQTKKLTLLQTVAAAGVFSAVSCWYGFMFGRESARRELGGIIDDLRRNQSTASTASSEQDTHSKS